MDDDGYDEDDEYDERRTTSTTSTTSDHAGGFQWRWELPSPIAVIGLFGVSQLRSDSGDGGVTSRLDLRIHHRPGPHPPTTTAPKSRATTPRPSLGPEDGRADETTPTRRARRVRAPRTPRPSSPTGDHAPRSVVRSDDGAGTSTAGYPTNPDGSPLPLVVIFDVDTITSPARFPRRRPRTASHASRWRTASSPTPQLVDNMVINPAVPISVGVRVIELNSARFPEGTATILPDHARELDRVVTIMQALPNISVLVVGHADQRGDDLDELRDLRRTRPRRRQLPAVSRSTRRPACRRGRPAKRSARHSADDDASLALNRRTEFIFYGLLIR